MKTKILTLLAIIIVSSLIAKPDEPHFQSKFLCYDRIRNVIAVDDSDEQHFYAATFGLENFDTDNTNTPEGVTAQLIKFTINNSIFGWTFRTIEKVRMNETELNWGGQESISSYSNDDEMLIRRDFQSPVDSMRIEGATGFWASPVLYDGKVILLNKSGTLILLNQEFTNGNATTLWHKNLRIRENSIPLSHTLEYMSTPTVIGDKIYVLGLQHLFIVDIDSGDIVAEISLTLNVGDQFIAPLTYDVLENGNLNLYAISKEHKLYLIDSNNSPTLITLDFENLNDNDLDCCWSAPIADNSGNILFTGSSSSNSNNLPRIDLLPQDKRISENEGDITEAMDINSWGDEPTNGYTGTIISDTNNGLYFLSNGKVDYYTKKYEFEDFEGDLSFNPLELERDRLNDQDVGYNYINNHPALLQREDMKRNVLVSIYNEALMPDYYPSQLENMDDENIRIRYTATCYEAADLYHASDLDFSDSNRTWGGITPYLTTSNCLNIMFADENGYINTYDVHMKEVAGIGPEAEYFKPFESVNPPLGYSKYQKGKDNVINYVRKENYKVKVLNPINPIEYIYINGYGRSAVQSITANNDTLYIAEFSQLLIDPSYTVTLLTSDGSGGFNTVQYENIDLDDNEITVNGEEYLLVNVDRVLSEEDKIYTKIIIDNATLSVPENFNHEYEEIEFRNGGTLELLNNSDLYFTNASCITPEAISTIKVTDCYGTGKLEIGTMSVNTNCNLLVQGSNVDSPSFKFSNLIVHNSADVEFLSLNDYSSNVSSEVNFMDNMGAVLINDKVEITGHYNEGNLNGNTTSLLKINYQSSFGHLVITCPPPHGNPSNQYNIFIERGFFIGDVNTTDAKMAQLTLDNPRFVFDCLENAFSYDVYGTINVLGEGKCIIQYGTLEFKENSHIELAGNINNSYNGAQLVAQEYSEIKLHENVSLKGSKSDPNPLNDDIFGDRVFVSRNSKLTGPFTDDPRKLINLRITSASDNLRWEGLIIKTNPDSVNYSEQNNFKLYSDNTTHSAVSGIDKIYVKYPGSDPAISNIDFSNCKYGVYVNNDGDYDYNLEVTNCSFEDCLYGIYFDGASSPYWTEISGAISDCNFGSEDRVNGYNMTGVLLQDISNVSLAGCNFYRNGYGIACMNSIILVGGHYETDLFGNTSIADDEDNYFYNNEKVGIYIGYSNIDKYSLIHDNLFEGTPNIDSQIGIWANGTDLDIIGNQFDGLSGHGVLLNSYTWDHEANYHGFSENAFSSNNGCELIGDAASLNQSAGGHNDFQDSSFNPTGTTPTDPFNDFDAWDKYFVACTSNNTQTKEIDLSNNYFTFENEEDYKRFYPDYKMFDYNITENNPLTQIISTGINQFNQGSFDESIESMKQAVEAYPDSSATKLAIDYLYLATRASNQDYATLREYLDMNISSETLATYNKKEDVTAKCYINEEEYIAAIEKLQYVIDNPETVADSLFAVVDQAYCYMNLASQGNKNLPNVSIATTDIEAYMDFLSQLSFTANEGIQDNNSVSPLLKIETNYPNPFNPETTIRYNVPSDGKVLVTIYNVKGQKVKELVNKEMITGRYSVVWNGQNTNGNAVGSGVYFVKIKQKNNNHLHKMMLMK